MGNAYSTLVDLEAGNRPPSPPPLHEMLLHVRIESMCWRLRRAEDERSAQASKIAKLESELKIANERLKELESSLEDAESDYETLKKDADWKLKCGPFQERERKAYYELKELCSSQHINLREDLDKAVAQFNEQRDRADELEQSENTRLREEVKALSAFFPTSTQPADDYRRDILKLNEEVDHLVKFILLEVAVRERMLVDLMTGNTKDRRLYLQHQVYEALWENIFVRLFPGVDYHEDELLSGLLTEIEPGHSGTWRWLIVTALEKCRTKPLVDEFTAHTIEKAIQCRAQTYYIFKDWRSQKMLMTIIDMAIGKEGKNVRISYAEEGSLFNDWNMEARTDYDPATNQAKNPDEKTTRHPRKVTHCVGFEFLNYEQSVFNRVQEKCMVVLDYKCDAGAIV